MDAEKDESQLQIRLFGTMEVRIKGGPIGTLRSSKGLQLLALLTLRQGRDVSRRWLAETLWPDSLPSQAACSLRQSLADLRRALADQQYRLDAGNRNLLHIDLTGVEVDSVLFDRAIKVGDTPSLQRAIALYHGPLLEGMNAEWVLGEREERQREYLKALVRLADISRKEGDTRNEVALLRRASVCDPMQETALMALMKALASADELQAALNVYRDYAHRLREQRSEPGQEMTEVYQKIRSRVQKRLLPKPLSSLPPQLHRVETAVRPLYSRGNLPQPLGRLIGRSEMLIDLTASLLKERLVTLVGTGGVGKTRLALEAANDLSEDFEEGIWFLDGTEFAAETSGEVIALAIQRLMELAEEGKPTRLEAVTTALRERHLLLIMDNCEHMIEGAATLALSLLASCRHLHILATSRQRLGLGGEVVVPTLPLQLPETGNETLETIRQAPAIELFVMRAQAIRPNFTLTRENWQVVVEICRRLDGLPLALELTAPLLEVLSSQELLARLSNRFALLDRIDPTRPLRHQTLHAAMESSVSLLSEMDRVLMRRLSVFISGWTMEAAQFVCVSTEDTGKKAAEGKTQQVNRQDGKEIRLLPTLRTLVGKSLVGVEERRGQSRYGMLESIREFAEEELKRSNEWITIRTRHLDYYVSLASLAETHLTGEDQSDWLERLEGEAGNLRRALAWAEKQPSCRMRGLQMAAALGRYWQIRGYFAEGREQLARLLAMTETQSPEPVRADALNWAGLLSVFQGALQDANAYCIAGLEIWESLKDEAGAAGSLGILGIVEANRGNLTAARRLYGRALERGRAVDDRVGVAGTLGYLGLVAAAEGYYEEAKTYYEESLALRQELRDTWGIAASLNNLGLLARKQGDLERAGALLHQALFFRRQLGDRRNIGITLNVLAQIAWQQNDPDTASLCFSEALKLFASLGDRRSIAYALEMGARLAATQGEWERSARLCAAASKLREEVQCPLPESESRELEEDFHSVRSLMKTTAYADALKIGRNWTLAQAIQEALHPVTPGQVDRN